MLGSELPALGQLTAGFASHPQAPRATLAGVCRRRPRREQKASLQAQGGGPGGAAGIRLGAVCLAARRCQRRRCPDVAGHILREGGIWEGLRVTQIMSDTFARGLHAAASARRWRLSGADGAICWSLVVTAVGVPLACWPWPLAPVFCSTINTVSGIDLPSKEKSLAWCSVWRAGPGAERARSRRPRPRPSSGAAEARGPTAG